MKSTYAMKDNKNNYRRNNNDKNQLNRLDYYDTIRSIESDGSTISNSKDSKSDTVINKNMRHIYVMKRNHKDYAINDNNKSQ